MERRVLRLENEVNSLQAETVEHKTLVTSLDESMKQIATTMSDIGKVMSANEVREEAHQSFKSEVITKLDKASASREEEREINREFHASIDKRVSVIELINMSRDAEVADLRKSKTQGLNAWKSGALAIIVSTLMVVISTYLKTPVT